MIKKFLLSAIFSLCCFINVGNADTYLFHVSSTAIPVWTIANWTTPGGAVVVIGKSAEFDVYLSQLITACKPTFGDLCDVVINGESSYTDGQAALLSFTVDMKKGQVVGEMPFKDNKYKQCVDYGSTIKMFPCPAGDCDECR